MKKKMSIWKLAVLVPVVAGFFFVVACQDQVMSEMTEVAENSFIATEFPVEVQEKLNEMKAKNPKGKFVVIEMNEDGKQKVHDLQAKYGALETNYFMEIKDKDDHDKPRQFLITEFDENAKQVADLSQSEDVFTLVEETATYPGGMTEWIGFVEQNFKYPEQARRIGVEGKVFVQFVVEKDGTLTNFEVIKGIGAGCDAEAKRVMALSKPWNPAKQRGKAVRQKMVMPIIFKLNEKSIETGSVEAVNKKFMVETVHETHNGGTVVKGIIKDEEGNPMPGTNIVLEGTTLGTVSDRDGTFTLKMKQSSGKIHVTFVGYDSQVIAF